MKMSGLDEVSVGPTNFDQVSGQSSQQQEGGPYNQEDDGPTIQLPLN